MRQALQAQFKDGPRLCLGQVIGAVVVHRMGRIVDQLDIGRDIVGRPAPLHQLATGFGRISRGPDGGNHLIDIGDRDSQTT